MPRTQHHNIYSYNGNDTNDQQNQPYDENYQEPYNQEEPYMEEMPYENEPYDGKGMPEPEVVSTSQAVNLTCTLAALSGIFAFFLYVADRRSDAVRRMSVQSIALSGGFICISVALLVVGTLFRFIPFLGIIIAVIFWLLFAALSLLAVFLKVQMMLHAYRGLSYQLPIVGSYFRRFE